MRKLLHKIKNRKSGHCLSVHQSAMVQSQWLKLFGTDGCYYPYTTELDMLADLLEHYNI